jgi:very-short-patch-repair endonuclease
MLDLVIRRLARDQWVRMHGTPRVTVLVGGAHGREIWNQWITLSGLAGTLVEARAGDGTGDGGDDGADGEAVAARAEARADARIDAQIRGAVARAVREPAHPIAVLVSAEAAGRWRAGRRDRVAAMVDEGWIAVPEPEAMQRERRDARPGTTRADDAGHRGRRVDRLPDDATEDAAEDAPEDAAENAAEKPADGVARMWRDGGDEEVGDGVAEAVPEDVSGDVTDVVDARERGSAAGLNGRALDLDDAEDEELAVAVEVRAGRRAVRLDRRAMGFDDSDEDLAVAVDARDRVSTADLDGRETTDSDEPEGAADADDGAADDGAADDGAADDGVAEPPRATGGPRFYLDARSVAEATLFEALEATPSTAGRFRLNESLSVRFGPAAAEVDLLSRGDRIAIEIDGMHHFADLVCYRRDRRKDLLLQTQGFVVVRLLAEDVVRDVRSAVTAINQVLAYRLREGRG